MKFRMCIILFLLSSAMVFSGGTQENNGKGTVPVKVYASILPQQYLLQEIGGDRIEAGILVPPGKSPATYSPSPRQVTDLGSADVFFTIGVPFETAFIPVIADSLKNLLIVDTSEGVQKRFIESHSHEEETESHVHEGETPDPHIWMSPLLAIHQGRIITETLCDIDPEGEEYYRKNLDVLVRELEAVDKLLAESLAPFEGKPLFVYHPAFGYFADRYGLIQVAVETGGKEPTAAQLEEIIEHAREEGVRVIFVQPEFPTDSAEAVAQAIGGVVVPVAPLSPDYIQNLRSIAEAIMKSWEK